MAQVESPPIELTLADLTRQFGAMPAWRIRTFPTPGAATEEDVIEIEAKEHRLCELVDGVLVAKTGGYRESYPAVELATELWNFVCFSTKTECGSGSCWARDTCETAKRPLRRNGKR